MQPVSEQAIEEAIKAAAQGSWVERTPRLWHLVHDGQVALSVVDAGMVTTKLGYGIRADTLHI